MSTGPAILLGVVAVITIVIIVWGISNTDDVEVDWLGETSTAALVVAIVGSAVIGFVMGMTVAWRRH